MYWRRSLRARRISQAAIAARAGVTRTMVSHVLHGRRQSPRVAAAIQALLASGDGRPPRRRTSQFDQILHRLETEMVRLQAAMTK